MSEQSAGEKTFEPTEKRKKDAAKDGNVLRSKEVATAVSVLVGAIWLKVSGPALYNTLADTFDRALRFDRQSIDDFRPASLMREMMIDVLPLILMLGLIVTISTVAMQMLLGDGRWVIKNLQPKAKRLNPITGFQKIIGVQSLIELGKSLAKLGLLGTIAWFWADANLRTVLSLGRGELTGQLTAAWDGIGVLVLLLACGLIVIAMIDWPIQYVRRMSKLKMTNQEVRDEHKQTEGSPEKKQAIRQRQRDMARGGVSRAVSEAQFLITNPTHFSIAMTYDPAVASAPYVLAKGQGEKALAMRELAAEHGVPVLEYPVLARAVYFTTRENQVIRAELYSAIASVLSFVMSLKRGEKPVRPSIVVPSELQFDTEGQLREA